LFKSTGKPPVSSSRLSCENLYDYFTLTELCGDYPTEQHILCEQEYDDPGSAKFGLIFEPCWIGEALMAVEELCESINIISSLIVSLSAQRIDSGGMHTRVIAKQSGAIAWRPIPDWKKN
jgi:hypothetical protein